MKKELLITLEILTIIFIFPVTVFAQSAVSNCWVTAVGFPGGLPKLPAGCGSNAPASPGNGTSGPCGSVVDWAAKIVPSLVIGGGGYLSGDGYDNRTQDFSSPCGHSSSRDTWQGQYWCTYLVIDAYNLAGISGLKMGVDDGVENMHIHFGSLPGFFTLPYNGSANQDTIQKIKPGFAIFFNNDYHVGLIKSISFDAHGNGTMDTYESNSHATSHTFTIAEWQIIASGYTINGFGGH